MARESSLSLVAFLTKLATSRVANVATALTLAADHLLKCAHLLEREAEQEYLAQRARATRAARKRRGEQLC
jgi:hypothetical protein